MKTIYIMLTRSETLVSKAIGIFTSDQYTHSSISFNENLSPLYSFARKGYLPLPGGLRLEYTDRGYYKEHEHIPCALYSLEVEDDVFYEAQRVVNEMVNELDSYQYNVIGLFLCKLNIPFERRHHYFCSQFVSEVLARANALNLPKHSTLMRPNDYAELPQLELCFKGKIKDLAVQCASVKPSFSAG